MAKDPKPVDPEKMSRRAQFVETYRMARKSDPRLGLWVGGSFVLGLAVGFGVFFLIAGGTTLGVIISVVGGLLLGALLAMIVFGRRAQNAAYSQMDGQPGAAAAALRMLRGRSWKSTPAIAFTKQQDVVHRLVGPPGIVLIGEGNPNRLKSLMATERRKHERVAADVPIHEVVCGNGPGEVPLAKLVRHVQKLGRSVKPAEMTDILNRLKALDSTRSAVPLPKGPVPTSMKGMRGQMRGR
ncbi:DUF4191 domain-containing protein [Nocardioides mangrovi]|uniref:DUF4191 domain-containing protein n=1 Tax=Nocardioides mangrovi TaxID=2874580 RepID=A0ABS7UH67_9ACTN|nr:DUF4191 domain-containing protein [Nocardioides mangrovi]MBZ5740341.1 DUF4191 domain-containing protein [Nocardioides mangrovi]